MLHSIQAMTSLMIGAPERPRRQPIDANLSSPLLANTRQMSSWSSPRTLTQNVPAASILGQLDEFFAGKNPTNGGGGVTPAEEPKARPAGRPAGPGGGTDTTPDGWGP